MTNWKYTNAGNTVVYRTNALGQLESKLATESDIVTAIGLGAVDAADSVALETAPPLALLFVLRSANMAITTDQQFVKTFSGTLYKPTFIVGKRRSGGASVACLGGVYTAASKGGDALVAAGQSWINLTANKKIVNASLTALVDTDIHDETPYLSLSTGSTAACTADIFIYGISLD